MTDPIRYTSINMLGSRLAICYHGPTFAWPFIMISNISNSLHCACLPDISIIGNVLFLSLLPVRYPLLILIYYWNSNCAVTLSLYVLTLFQFIIRTSSHTVLTMDRE
jgi:hypothetical protein